MNLSEQISYCDQVKAAVQDLRILLTDPPPVSSVVIEFALAWGSPDLLTGPDTVRYILKVVEEDTDAKTAKLPRQAALRTQTNVLARELS